MPDNNKPALGRPSPAPPLVLVAAHLPWSEQWQTPQYVAELLARTADVLYVEPPISWNPATGAFGLRRLLCPGKLRRIDSRLWAFAPPSVPLGRFAPIKRANDRKLQQAVLAIMPEFGERSIYLWICATRHGPALRRLFPRVPCVYHGIDLMLQGNEARAAEMLSRQSDLVLGSSAAIVRHLAEWHDDVVLFPNGWKFSTCAEELTTPADLEGIPRPRIGIVGFLNRNLDYQLISRIADSFPNPVVLIGGAVTDLLPEDRRALRELLARKNVFALGPKPLARVPSYIFGMDVCLAPYKQSERIFGSDPLKVYQYLALGKPVVSSDVEALHAIDGLVRIARNHEEFSAAVALELSDSSESRLREQRMAFAASTTWQSRWSALARQIPAGSPFAGLF